jgi:hypothetical protein
VFFEGDDHLYPACLLAAVTIGVLMGYRADLPFAWSRALVAALAFAVLGGLLSYVRARRK